MNKLPSRDIESLWNLYENISNKLQDENIKSLVENLGQRIAEQSMSQRTNESFCGIGGLLEYSLELAKTAKKLNESLILNLDNLKIMKLALLSEIGRIGDQTNSRFVDTTSEWHKEKLGQYYDWNEACPKFKVRDMTLWFLQKYNIELSWDEWLTINHLGDTEGNDKSFYSKEKSSLSMCLLMAQDIVYTKENDRLKREKVLPF